jgi:hypothetical protein
MPRTRFLDVYTPQVLPQNCEVTGIGHTDLGQNCNLSLSLYEDVPSSVQVMLQRNMRKTVIEAVFCMCRQVVVEGREVNGRIVQPNCTRCHQPERNLHQHQKALKV